MLRNKEIDYLRFIGLALIILAHVNPPGALFQLRNFDVPLMVIVSAMSYAAAYKPVTNYISYIWSRFKRLVIPTWLFLSTYFLAISALDSSSPDLDKQTIVDSYMLLEGIGYIWIIRVFLLVALAAPFIYKFHLKTTKNLNYFATLSGVYIFYELALMLGNTIAIPSGLELVINQTIFYLIPFGVLFAYGLRMSAMSQKEHLAAIALSFIIFTAYAVILYLDQGKFIQTQEFKYPPTAYFLSFALLAIEALWLARTLVWKIFELTKVGNTVILFVAHHSLWIYFWHIPIIKYVHLGFVGKYVVAFAAATLAVALQDYVVNRIIAPRCKSEKLKRNIRTIFIG